MSSKTAEAPERTEEGARQRQPWYRVVLLDDDQHSYAYVIALCQRVFGRTREEGLEHATEVDTHGRTVLLTTTLEHAELKRDQVHGFGPDALIASSAGPMSAVLEPEADE